MIGSTCGSPGVTAGTADKKNEMERVYRNFYRNFYNRTGGFIPSQPYDQNMYPGDFFQITNGEIMVMGNIFRKGLIRDSDVVFGNGIHISPAGWIFNDGMTKPYSGRGSGHGPIAGDFEYSKQVLAFADKGSFFFRGSNPESVRILNWGDFQQELIIKMTQALYSFRELYIVTESAATSDWTLAISGAAKAELEIATDEENFGLVDIFGHHKAKTIQSKDIEFYHREDKRKPSFFKAKKLVVQDEKLNVFISELISNRESHHQWAGGFFEYQFQHEPGYLSPGTLKSRAGTLDMLQANELNPNTALLYFKWEDAGLDDIEKLFMINGY
jgi:hypothetical protein